MKILKRILIKAMRNKLHFFSHVSVDLRVNNLTRKKLKWEFVDELFLHVAVGTPVLFNINIHCEFPAVRYLLISCIFEQSPALYLRVIP